MKRLTHSLWVLALVAGPALAQNAAGEHAGHHASGGAAAAPANAAELSDGEIRRIDKSTGKLTLKHGEIKNLDMPPMTMVFQVKDATWLDTVKVGDKVRFRAEASGSAYVVTALEALK